MPEWIAKYWIQWAFGIITGAPGLAYKRLSAKVKKHEEERQAKAKAQEAEMAAIKEGLLAILHDRLYQACTYYIALGHIDTAASKTSNTSTRHTTPWVATERARNSINGPRRCQSASKPSKEDKSK